MPIVGAIGLATLAFSGYQYVKSRNDKKKADNDFQQTLRNRSRYATPASVTEVAADARSRINAQNPATIAAQQQLQQQAAAEAGFAQRNATSGTQAIQAAADANAQTYSAVPGLAAADAVYRDRQVQNYYSTQQGLTEDARYQHADALDANNTQANYNLGRVGAAQMEGSQALATGIQGLGMVAGAVGNSNYRMPRLGRITPMANIQPVASSMSVAKPAVVPQPYPTYGLNAYVRKNYYQPYAFGNY